jgi:small subunit ribosomal protein S17
MEKQKINKKENAEKLVGTSCKDIDCPTHGNLSVRGRSFDGKVIRKFNKRITIEFERMIYVQKYERYTKSRTKIHARLPKCMEQQINLGDLIRVQECRPLSKIIHFVVIKKLKDKEELK